MCYADRHLILIQTQNNDSHCFLCLFCCLTSQSTTMVMSRQSVNLTTRFLGRLRPRQLTSTQCTFFCQKLTTALLESVAERERVHDQSPRKKDARPEDHTCDLLNTSWTCIRLSPRARHCFLIFKHNTRQILD